DLLMTCPPRVVASAVETWVAAQYRGAGDGASLADYLFHSMKKINHMAQLKLIERERMKKYLDALGTIVVEMCPKEDREAFANTLKSLGDMESEMAPSVELIRGGASAGAAAVKGGGGSGASGRAGALSEELTRGLKRFS